MYWHDIKPFVKNEHNINSDEECGDWLFVMTKNITQKPIWIYRHILFRAGAAVSYKSTNQTAVIGCSCTVAGRKMYCTLWAIWCAVKRHKTSPSVPNHVHYVTLATVTVHDQATSVFHDRDLMSFLLLSLVFVLQALALQPSILISSLCSSNLVSLYLVLLSPLFTLIYFQLIHLFSLLLLLLYLFSALTTDSFPCPLISSH